MSFELQKDTSIYVAGHTGLIGSAFERYFNATGYNNLVLRLRKELDLTNSAAVKDFFDKERPKVVILAAGLVGGILANRDQPADFIVQNLSIQLNVMRCAAEAGTERLLFFGSSCMYPKSTEQPMKESQLCTGHPEETSIAYASAKFAGLQMCEAFNRQIDENKFISVIPNSVYGANDNFDPDKAHVLSSLIHKFHQAKMKNMQEVVLWGSGLPRREFIYVDDLVRICIKILKQNPDTFTLPVNIGVGEDISIKELAEKVKTVTGYQGEISWDTSKPDGSAKKLLDSERLSSILGEFDFTPLNRGLEYTYNWYLENQT